ncbi:hypothetical protein Pint_27099 [Pistacia integerrima]|uniref:Uncharacterized protein n=1 Tax=Pistacia integerrima TaxID=434235 RepID=A0ACC0YV74_9ROSI|nr:hypothetical protein Pint_27099 [Pistacia integerrima]
MATKLLQPPLPAHQAAVPPLHRLTSFIKAHRFISATHPWPKNTALRSIFTTKVAKQTSGLAEDDKETPQRLTLAHLKADLFQQVQGINRGIFGVPSGKKSEIERLVELLESQNPTPDPTVNLENESFNSISIFGDARMEGKAVNVIKFNVRGLNLLNGQLTIEASFKIASKSRVDINYDNSMITPDQLMNMFRKNYDILLGIFNPDGWLEITYVDDTMRIGRDDKGNIFILKRSEESITK